MIHIYPGDWIASVTIAGLVLTTAAAAALVTLRWGWKAWPLLLLNAVVTPLVTGIILVMILYEFNTVVGFGVDVGGLVLAGLPSTLVGFGSVRALHHIRSRAG
jgi:hypothetical protein